tara:strand:+ start:5436 stop:5903 length:468 start_codon:yes stop_codon:yes gene_type:complete
MAGLTREEKIRKFRRDCVESMVGNTCDNIHDTGNSLTGVSISESAAYYLVRSSYYEGDLEDVAQELSDMAEVCGPDHDMSPGEIAVASLWNEDDIKVEVVGILRQMTGHPLARDLLLQCSDVIEGLFDESSPWPEMSELLGDIHEYLNIAGEGGD